MFILCYAVILIELPRKIHFDWLPITTHPCSQISANVRRSSEDKVQNQFGDHHITFCQIFDLAILNGMCDGDKYGKYTFISPRGSNVVDYVWLSHELLALNKHLKMGDQILSHHLPLKVVISTGDCDVNARDCEVSKAITNIVYE